ncbi:MAG: serine/threonine-protein kinase [Anaerolineales bacterium]
MSMGNLGPYSLAGKLGAGDMGTCYKTAANPPQCLKVLDKIDTSARMQREAGIEIIEVAATLEHPRLWNIDAVLDSPDGNGQVAVVMPLSPVGSLADLFKKGKQPPPKVAFGMITQVSEALGYLHEQEIAHGSIKPSNVLLDKNGGAHLTDLPMAHLRELGFVPAQPTKMQLLFMPPEREYHAPPDIAADVFGLAVLAYLLLTTKMPFTETEAAARGIVPQHNLPPALCAVLRRAVNQHTRLRYTSLDELMTALRDASRGKVDEQTERVFGVNAPPPGPEDAL